MDKPTFPDIDGLLGSIRHVATPVGQQTVSDEPDGTTTESKENIPDNENPEDRPECGTLSWQIFQHTDSGSGKMSGKSA